MDPPIFQFDNEEAEPPFEVKHVAIDASQVQVLRAQAFSRQTELAKVEFRNLPSSRLREIGDFAFQYCACLHSIFQMPLTLQRIGQGAFLNCSNLGFVHLPEGIRVIGGGAFEFCVSLVTIRVPSTVRFIERAAFRGCRQLRSVELPPTLESIGGVAYHGCVELVNICLPANVNISGANIFTGCNKLVAEGAHPEMTTDETIKKMLLDRYRGLPVHQLCYYQSYDSQETNLENLKDMVTSQFFDFEDHVDALGMSPFHVLALSAAPNAKLAEAVVKKVQHENMALDKLRSGCLRMFCCSFFSQGNGLESNQEQHVPRLLSNALGQGALFFACLNIAPGSTEMIKYIFRLNASRELAQFGLKEWRDQVYRLIDRELDTDTTPDEANNNEDGRNFDYGDRLEKIRLMGNHVARYLLKEKVSILELVVWKTALEGTAANSRDRETCRALCGADTIVTSVLPFLAQA